MITKKEGLALVRSAYAMLGLRYAIMAVLWMVAAKVTGKEFPVLMALATVFVSVVMLLEWLAARWFGSYITAKLPDDRQ